MAACIIYLIFCLAAAAAAPGSRRYGILDGELTTIDKYPFQVALHLYDHFIGSGVIINSRHVLTAGQNIFVRDKHLLIRAGSSFYNENGTLYNVAKSIIHPDYDYTFLRNDNYEKRLINDIGIYRTTTDIVFSDVVKPVNIAPPDYKLDDDEPVWVIGWGMIVQTTCALYSQQLRRVKVLTVSKEKCIYGYEGILKIVDEMVCAGTGQGDACRGDDGGPLLHNGVLVGIVSTSADCNSPDHPTIYTRVSSYSKWIKDNSEMIIN